MSGLTRERQRRDDQRLACPELFVPNELRVSGDRRQRKALGQFVRKRPAKRRGPAPTVVETAFDDEKAYVLTELGRRFVHYTLSDAVGRLADGAA